LVQRPTSCRHPANLPIKKNRTMRSPIGPIRPIRLVLVPFYLLKRRRRDIFRFAPSQCLCCLK
jgi:hypothetical protein